MWTTKVVLTIAVTWFVARRIGLGIEEMAALDPARWRPRWGALAAASATLLAAYVISGLAWGRVVRDLGGTSLEPAEGIRIYLVSNLARYLPGKLWQLAGVAVLAGRRGVPVRVATAGAVLAHVMSLAAATLYGSLVLLGESAAYPAWVVWAPIALLAGLGTALLPPVFRALLSVSRRLGVELEAFGFGQGKVVAWLMLFLVQWLAYGGAFAILARSFGLPGAALEVSAAFVAAYVLGYVALFAPAGIGVREVALTGLLAPAMGTAPAAGLAVVARVWITVVEVVPAAVFWSREVAGEIEEGTT